MPRGARRSPGQYDPLRKSDRRCRSRPALEPCHKDPWHLTIGCGIDRRADRPQRYVSTPCADLVFPRAGRPRCADTGAVGCSSPHRFQRARGSPSTFPAASDSSAGRLLVCRILFRRVLRRGRLLVRVVERLRCRWLAHGAASDVESFPKIPSPAKPPIMTKLAVPVNHAARGTLP